MFAVDTSTAWSKQHLLLRQPADEGHVKRTTCRSAATASAAPDSKMLLTSIVALPAAALRSTRCSMHSTGGNAARHLPEILVTAASTLLSTAESAVQKVCSCCNGATHFDQNGQVARCEVHQER